jgi:hypothetical protein
MDNIHVQTLPLEYFLGDSSICSSNSRCFLAEWNYEFGAKLKSITLIPEQKNEASIR